MSEDQTPRGKPCPICGKPAEVRFRPFCSSRCADVDLHRWFSESYRVPVDDEEGDEAPKPARDPDHDQS